jgi:predicted TIM-barrel fold metal-dependent hydrolase
LTHHAAVAESPAMRSGTRLTLDKVFVLDATVHAYSLAEDNWVPGPYRDLVPKALAEMLASGQHVTPDGDPKWALDRRRFLGGADPDLLGRALFLESYTDMCVYHSTPMYGIFKDGGSPLWAGKQMQKDWPGRVALYGGVSPWKDDAVDEVERLVVEDVAVGIKMYPMDIVEGRIASYRLDDPEIAFPILEKARSLGVKVVATHKSIPQGRVPSEPFAPFDVAGAAAAFPDLTIEIVHGGLAFLEETASQIQRFPNVAVNLENSGFLMVKQPARFAHLLGELIVRGGEDRIFWSSGATARHPQPFLQAFWDFQIPARLQDEYGYPELTPELKEKILGLNQARMLGWNVQEIRRGLEGDDVGMVKKLREPWGVSA